MATTITYKGSVIATATNSTKTLNTQGKYMEGNVIIKDEGFPVLGVFYVYHTSSCQIEKIEIPDADNWTIDLTKLVPEGYLYGGYFSYYGTSSGTNGASKQFTYQDLEEEEFVNNLWLDANGTPYNGGKANVFQPSLAYTDDGTSLSPTINQVYYLSEVPNDFLRQRVDTFGANDTVSDLLIYICLDRGNTSFLGISVPDLYDTKRTVLTINIDGTLYTANKMFNEKVYIDKTISIPRGYLTADLIDVSQYPDNSNIIITPTWITLDGVQVFGAITYTVNLGSHTTSTYTITPSLYSGKKAVSRSNAYPLESQTITPSTSQQIVVASSSSFYGLGTVTVEAIPSSYVIPSGTINITSNGSVDVSAYATASVSVQGGATINNQNKSVTPSESQQSVTYDNGYTGLGTVTVDAVSASYVGSNIARKSSSDLTASGSVVTVPAGYYSANASKAISNASQMYGGVAEINANGDVAFDVEIDSGGYIDGGTYRVTDSGAVTVRSSSDLTASGSAVTAPAGYYSAAATKTVSAGTAGTPTAAKGTVSNHQISITPSVTNTTGWITGSTKTGTAATVSASELVSGTSTISANGTYDVTNYASAAVSIPIVTYYTGSAAPTTGLGSNGDIYLQGGGSL